MSEVLKNKKKSEILAERIKELYYGEVVSHKRISKGIEEDYPSNKYSTTISKARKLLMKEGICLENIIGDGYRIVNPDNFVDHSLKHYKRGFNEMQKGYDVLTYAPTKNMSQEGRVRYRRVHDRAVTLTAAMKGASVELKTLSSQKKHPMSPENVNR